MLEIQEFREKLSRRRQLEIQNMARSLRETIPIGVFNMARAEPLLSASEEAREAGVPSPMTAILAVVLSRTLADHSALHSRIDGEDLVSAAGVGLGIAVAGKDGSLAVPVLEDADKLGLAELATRLANVAARARNHKLRPSEMSGGGFTLSNVGMAMRGGQGAGIIPPGQGGLLVVGGVLDSPVIDEGTIRPGKLLPLSLTFDHRVANGIAAWQFFSDLINRIQGVHVDDVLRIS